MFWEKISSKAIIALCLATIDVTIKYLLFLTTVFIVGAFDVATNPGASFGILSGLSNVAWILIMCVIFFLLYIFSEDLIKISEMGFWLILFGGVSNLHDRVFFGVVIDYINYGVVIGNGADIMLLVGFTLIAYNYWKHHWMTMGVCRKCKEKTEIRMRGKICDGCNKNTNVGNTKAS